MSYGILDEIKKFILTVDGKYRDEFLKLEEEFARARDNTMAPVPIYFSKWRVKKPESAYLKVKKKGRSYRTLTDYGGMRLLCLFESDMVKIHDFLLSLFIEMEYDLYECIIYNFDRKGDMYFALKQFEQKHFPGHFMSSDSKMSGYKSIHYLVYTKDGLYIEVQLRTLVQDVWGELEHALSYKNGSAHPHIKKSFYLLSKDLENVDDMLSYLKDLEEKERAANTYSDEKERPTFYFEYEEDLLPMCFSKASEIHEKYKEYRNCIDKAITGATDELYLEARRTYEDIRVFGLEKYSDDSLLDYWLKMEDAFIDYGGLNCEDAIKKYIDILVQYPERYCIYYRIGQIYLIKEKIADALSCFDEVSRLLEKDKGKNILNQYRIRILLAYTYWQLGTGYIDLSICEIEKAEKIYNDNKDSETFGSHHYFGLINNIAWYGLERYILSTKNKGDLKKRVEADRYYAYAVRKNKILENYVEKEDCDDKASDTLAWFYYQKYRRTKCLESLKKAKAYAVKMSALISDAKHINMLNIKIRHIQEIMQECNEVLGLRYQMKKDN